MKKSLLILCLLLTVCGHLASLAQPVNQGNKWKETSKTTTVEVTSGGAVSLPLLVSLLALVSALASVAFSLKVKDKEYRNDYFKKVIEKRLKAIEKDEELIGLLADYTVKYDDKGKQIPGSQYHTNLLSDSGRELIKLCKASGLDTAMWESPKTEMLYNDFNAALTEALIRTANVDKGKRFNILVEVFDDIETLMLKLEESLNDDMATLYDVKSFFKAKKAHSASLVNEPDKGKRLTRPTSS